MGEIMNFKQKLIAHRGYYNKIIPENSTESFKKCLYFSIPIELDFHLTKDHQVVVFHDFSLKRMIGISKNIEDLTYGQLSQFFLKNSKEKIPLLKDILKIIHNEVPILIELKNKKIGPLENALISLLDSYQNFALQTFQSKSIYYLKKRRPNYQVGILLFRYRILRYSKIDFICCSNLGVMNYKIQKYKGIKPIIIWNIETKEQLKKISDYGDAYIVDIKKFI